MILDTSDTHWPPTHWKNLFPNQSSKQSLTHSFALTYSSIYQPTLSLSLSLAPTTHSLTNSITRSPTHSLLPPTWIICLWSPTATCQRMAWDIASNSVRGRRPCYVGRRGGLRRASVRAGAIVICMTRNFRRRQTLMQTLSLSLFSVVYVCEYRVCVLSCVRECIILCVSKEEQLPVLL